MTRFVDAEVGRGKDGRCIDIGFGILTEYEGISELRRPRILILTAHVGVG
jgi:hypothetical protein